MPIDVDSTSLDTARLSEVAGPPYRLRREIEDTQKNVNQVSHSGAGMRHAIGLPPPLEGPTSSESDSDNDPINDMDSGDVSSDPLARSSETVMAAPRPLLLAHKAFMSSRLTSNTPIPCNLAISESRGLISLWATADTGPITPSILLFHDTVYKHSLLLGVDSFPSIKHPSIDTITPMNKDAPYSIHFVRPQTQSVNRHPAHEYEACGVKYHFEDPKDRDDVRQIIFDKKLLVAVGIDEVWIKNKTACVKESLTLWQRHPVDDQPPVITITFPYYLERNSTAPERVVEYLVCTRKNFVEDLRKAKLQHKKLRLDVRSMPKLDSDHEDDLIARQTAFPP